MGIVAVGDQPCVGRRDEFDSGSDISSISRIGTTHDDVYEFVVCFWNVDLLFDVARAGRACAGNGVLHGASKGDH